MCATIPTRINYAFFLDFFSGCDDDLERCFTGGAFSESVDSEDSSSSSDDASSLSSGLKAEIIINVPMKATASAA